MAEVLKVLAQTAPSATTLTDSYTVPAATQAVISTGLVCNRGGATATFRVSVAIAGAADTPAQYLYFNETLKAGKSFALTLGLSLGALDVIRVYSSTADLSFNFFGTEVT